MTRLCRAMAKKYSPRKRHAVEDRLRLSGLEPLQYEPDPEVHRRTFLNIGERCNVAGSSIYKKAIVDGNYDKALAIAVKQVCRPVMLVTSVRALSTHLQSYLLSACAAPV